MMISIKIVNVLGAALLIHSSFARPRAPHSPRFPQSSGNSVGEYVLWSCTATAQLQKTNVNKNVIRIEPAALDSSASGSHVPISGPPSRDGDDQINKIKIIEVNTIPHRNRGRPEAVSKEQNAEIDDQEIRHRSPISLIVDSPLKTIKVNSFRKDMPVLFKEKPQLPQLENVPTKEDQNLQYKSQITVIKPLNSGGK